MASKKTLEFFSKAQKGEYINQPGTVAPPGRKGEAIIRGVQTARDIQGATTPPQTNNNPDSTLTALWSLPGHPRTVRHEYYPEQRVMKVWWGSTPPGPPYYYYSITQDEFDDFTNSPSPGRWINDHPEKEYSIAF